MTISNRLIYNNKLRCGSEQIARRGLNLPNRTTLASFGISGCHKERDWIDHLLLERYFLSSVFIRDIEALSAPRQCLSIPIVYQLTSPVSGI
jgi:DNA replication ATP-dependent helicase Dna2